MEFRTKNAREGLKKILPELTEEAWQYILGYGEGYVAAKDAKKAKEEKVEIKKGAKK